MKEKVVFSLLLSLAVLAGCTRMPDTPSSEMPSIENVKTPVSSLHSSTQPPESSSSSEPRPFREVGQWVTLSEEPELEEVTQLLEEKMKGAASLKVALEVEAQSGDTWFDAK